jgi:hypothetical protein
VVNDVTTSAFPRFPNSSNSDRYGQVLSPGTKMNEPFVAAPTARIQPYPIPMFWGLWMTRTSEYRSARASATVSVPSVLPSSTMMTS